jgi:peptide-methionine (S)-S-oxide reductase
VRARLAALLLVALSPAAAGAQPAPTAVATFASGCFWCTESDFEHVPGVVEAVSGYIGGTGPEPTYQTVSAGGTGYAEAVQLRYDPARVSFAQLLEVFWRGTDPVDGGGQFCDRGDQYRSAIFVHDEAQRAAALQSREMLAQSGRLGQPIVTEIASATTFYPAEAYHQDYYKKNPVRYKLYRYGCGRDRRLAELWGADH